MLWNILVAPTKNSSFSTAAVTVILHVVSQLEHGGIMAFYIWFSGKSTLFFDSFLSNFSKSNRKWLHVKFPRDLHAPFPLLAQQSFRN